jgi:hypothetical protein
MKRTNQKPKSSSQLARLLPVVEPEQVAKPPSASAFEGVQFREVIQALEDEIRDLYLADDIPWIVGYSGGKDSTATLQLVWNALAGLPESNRQKEVHVISTDTLVENPIVAQWVAKSLHTHAPSRARTWQLLLGQLDWSWLPSASAQVSLVH